MPRVFSQPLNFDFGGVDPEEVQANRYHLESVPRKKNQAVKVSPGGSLGAQGLAPMQFDAIFLSPPPLSAKRSKSSVKTKSLQGGQGTRPCAQGGQGARPCTQGGQGTRSCAQGARAGRKGSFN